MDGIVNIDKPQGMTSFGVVAKVKRISGERHTGHAGTLDPLATGVLPVCLGQATRVIEFLQEAAKIYRARIQLGVSTDTYDAAGRVLDTGDASGITCETVKAALPGFTGDIRQVPPMYSALKHNGQPLYRLARAGIEVERQSRPVRIYSLEITDWQPPVVTLDIECGKGTYIRSLAHDLGRVLGCGAHVQELTRLRVGPFTIGDALTIPRLEQAFREDRSPECLYPADFVLSHMPAVVVDGEQASALLHGSQLALQPEVAAGHSQELQPSLIRAYTAGGVFIGLIRYDPESQRWQPQKIFLKRGGDG